MYVDQAGNQIPLTPLSPVIRTLILRGAAGHGNHFSMAGLAAMMFGSPPGISSQVSVRWRRST
jgi:hypothetical protein